MSEIPELDITCGTADCSNGRHSFNNPAINYKRRGKNRKILDPGVCMACGVAPIDWPRIHARQIGDFEYTLSALRLETIRWWFWVRPFNERSIEHAKSHAPETLYAEIHPTLTRIIGPVGDSPWANRQVPTKSEKMKNVIQYAQHAVAACCRKCVHTWHGIPNVEPLQGGEIQYLEALVKRYLQARLVPVLGSQFGVAG